MKKLFGLAALLAVTALAACGGNQDSFEKADHDKDGRVTFSEAVVVAPDLAASEFAVYDEDKNGGLDPKEYGVFIADRAEGKRPLLPAPPSAKSLADQAKKDILGQPGPESSGQIPAAPGGAPAVPAVPVAPGGAPSASAPAVAPEPAQTAVEVVEVTETVTEPEGGQSGTEGLVMVEEAPVVEKAAPETTYELKRGDNLSKVAAKYGVSLKALMEANGVSNADRVEAGTKLVIPGTKGAGKEAGKKAEVPGKSASGPLADKARLFVDGFLVKSASKDAEGLADMYGDKVRFYKKGEVDKGFIRKDKRDYFARWPHREYALVEKAKVYDTDRKNVKKVVFTTNYAVSNDAKRLAGEAEFTLLIAFDGDRGLIVAEDGKVLKRN